MSDRRKVVIVGGGLAGLTTAYELSRTEEARARWDVEVIEMGHRWGGRMASAHRPERCFRNEEHGLHVWFGWYDNTFRLANEVWSAWRKPEGCPWQSLWDALRPIYASDHGLVDGDAFEIRRVHHARNSGRPGVAHERSWAARLTGWLDSVHTLPRTLRSVLGGGSTATTWRLPSALRRSLWPTPDDDAVVRELERRLDPLFAALGRLSVPGGASGRRRAGVAIERLLRSIHRPLVEAARTAAGTRPGPLALVHTVDLGLAVARGIASPEHGIMEDGDFDRISAWELRAWLRHHGADDDTLRRSRLLECLYDIPFAFVDGNRDRPVLEASTALRFTLRILAGYKHAIAYLLSGGAGETIVAPLYEVLRDRGVRFRPFHRLVDLDVDPRGRRLTALRFVRAARVRDTYDPLIGHDGLRGMRADPDWTQLHDGQRLRDRGVDFYSRFADRGETDEVVLELDRDYDDVVLALPLGCVLPDADGHTPVAAWLDAHPPARACLEKLHLVPSVAAQVWMGPSAASLDLEGKAVVTWSAPYSVVCDMTPTTRFERWPAPGPGACAYLCGAWPLSAHRAPRHDREALSRDQRTATVALDEQLARHGRSLFAGDATPVCPPGVEPGVGRYVRANVEPWDLADLALPGADAVRLDAADTGLVNLALAGSWVRTYVNTTSIEAAVASGIAAARALGAATNPILGESLFRRPSRAPLLPGRRLPDR